MDEPRLSIGEELSPEQWRERALACFESLRARNIALTVETMDGVQMEAQIESLDDSKGRMVISIPRAPSAGLQADDEVQLFFSMQGNRWGGHARIHYHNERRNRFTLILPARLDPGDRRRELRLFLDTAENIKATFRPSGLEFLLVTGRLSNLSEGGFRMTVESAVDTDDGRPVDPGDVPLEENQHLGSISITGLRDEPVLSEGVVLEMDREPIGPILGIRFRYLSRSDQDFLRTYVSARAEAAPTLIPLPPPEPEKPVAEGTAEEPTDELQRIPIPVAPEAPNEGLELVSTARPSQEDQRLRRFKTLALVMPPGPDRDALQFFLVTQGFTRIVPAGTVSELAGLAKKMPPDVFLVDWPNPATPELDIVLFLGNHPFPSPPRIVLACLHATTQLAREATRLGVTQLLVKPYPLDETLVEILQQQLRGDDL